MAAPSQPQPARPAPGPGRHRSALGWAAASVATLITSAFAAAFAGETVASLKAAPSWPAAVDALAAAVFPFVVLILAVALAAAAAHMHRVGVVYALLGLVLLLPLPGFPGARAWPIAALLLVTGLLYYAGHPEPRRRAVRLAIWAPAALALVAGVTSAVLSQGPPGQ